jgi:hypothetical protein
MFMTTFVCIVALAWIKPTGGGHSQNEGASEKDTLKPKGELHPPR